LHVVYVTVLAQNIKSTCIKGQNISSTILTARVVSIYKNACMSKWSNAL